MWHLPSSTRRGLCRPASAGFVDSPGRLRGARFRQLIAQFYSFESFTCLIVVRITHFIAASRYDSISEEYLPARLSTPDYLLTAALFQSSPRLRVPAYSDGEAPLANAAEGTVSALASFSFRSIRSIRPFVMVWICHTSLSERTSPLRLLTS